MIDRMMPKWRALWAERGAEDERQADGITWTSPHPMLHPELNDLARPCFGYGNPFPEFGMDAEMQDFSWVASAADNRVVITFAALGWASAPAMRALRIVLVYATRDPERQHYQLAEAVIRANEKREATEKERRALGEAIHEAARELAKRLGWDAEGLAKLPLWTAADVGRELGSPHPLKVEFDHARHDELVAREAAAIAKGEPGFLTRPDEDKADAVLAKLDPAQYTERVVHRRFGRVVNAETLDLAGSYQKVADLIDDWRKADRLAKNGERLAKGFREPSLYEEKLEERFVRPKGPKLPEGCAVRSPTLSPLFWALTETLWLDKVRERVREETKREQELALRRKRFPAPTLPLIFARTFGRLADPELKPVVAPGGALTRFETDGYGRVRLHVPAAARLALSEAFTVPKELGRVLVPLVAHLTRAAHERWINGEERFDYIPVRTGRDELRTLLGVDATVVDVLAALHFLQDFTVAGIPCVSSIIEPKDDSPRNGRPREGLVVQLGAPLAPHGLERVFGEAGLALPPDLRWYGPIFDPSAAPVQGQQKTFWVQRNAYTLGLGVTLIELRKSYAENGGVTLEQLLEALGDTIRAPRKTVESLLKTWRQLPPYQDSMSWNGPEAEPPVLVEVTRGSGIYRLSPQRHEGAHQLIVDAGAHAKEKAARMARAAAIEKRAQRGKPPAKP